MHRDSCINESSLAWSQRRRRSKLRLSNDRQVSGGHGFDRRRNDGNWCAVPAMAAIGPKSDVKDCGHGHEVLTPSGMDAYPAEPPHDCPICPRLVTYRVTNRMAHPDWWNAPVPGWGDVNGWLCVVGLAPGVTGANRTGRPFTGDHAGLLLYSTLAKFGLSHGTFAARPDDGLTLDGVFISNAVRCVPPANRPLPAEVHTCRPFLTAQLTRMPRLQVVLALGTVAHQSAVKALGGKLPKVPFGHGAVHRLANGMVLVDSYHCSRYNTNTGRLTPAMFEAAFAAALNARPPLHAPIASDGVEQ